MSKYEIGSRWLLRVPEVASLLGVSVRTIREWISAGVLPVVRVPGGRAVLVPKRELDMWVQQHTRAATGLTSSNAASTNAAAARQP